MKADQHVTPQQRLSAVLKMERRDVSIAVVYSLVIGLLSLVVPVATQLIVNTVAFGTLVQPLVVLTLVVLLGLGFSALLQTLRTVVVEIIQRRVFVRTGADLVRRFLRANAELFDKEYGPELVNRFFEVVTVQKSGSMLLIDGLSVCMQTLLGMILLAVYHPWLLAFDFLLILLVAFVLFGLGRNAVTTSIDESKAKYSTVAWLEELARHIITFKSAPGIAYAIQRADKLFSEYLRHRKSHFRILVRQQAGFLALQAVASAALLAGGGYLVMQRQLTLGQLVAAELVVALILNSLAKFSKYLETYYDLMAAMDKLGHIQDFPLEREGGETVSGTEKGVEIRVRDLVYDYPGKPAFFEGLNWTITPGRHIALSGMTGGGKSTLLDLIYGLRTPSMGSIEIDGVDYRQVDLDSLRANVALVRTSEVFHGTVEENLRLGNPMIPAPEVRKALAAVGLLDDIGGLPNGLQTELSTGGRPLSTGQCARLMIARAMLQRPRLLLLDECLDSVEDTVEREMLLDVLFQPSAPWCVLVATESESIQGRCDQVFTIKEGEVEERSAKSRWSR